MSPLPPGCNLANDPGQYDPPDWAYVLELSNGEHWDFGWDYQSLKARASGDESRIKITHWEL